jgi:hypothetical protein
VKAEAKGCKAEREREGKAESKRMERPRAKEGS